MKMWAAEAVQSRGACLYLLKVCYEVFLIVSKIRFLEHRGSLSLFSMPVVFLDVV